MLMNSREIWKSLQCAPQFARVSQPHMPLRSGFPSLVRGAAAAMSGLPSAVRGTSGVGYSSHWPDPARGSTPRITAARRRHRLVRMISPLLQERLQLREHLVRRFFLKVVSGRQTPARPALRALLPDREDIV